MTRSTEAVQCSASSLSMPACSITGIGFAVTAYSLLAAQDATVKWLLATTPVWQVLFVRSAIIVLACGIGGGRRLIRQALTTPTKALLVRRAVVALAAWVCYFTAARDLPLGQVTTLYFTAPLVVAVLAAPLLNERVNSVCLVAIGTGFAGTTLATDLSGLSMSLPTGLVLLAALLWGYGVILMRQIAKIESSLVQLFFNNGCFFVVTGVGCVATWQPPTMAGLLLLLQVAVLSGLGQFCLFESARLAPVSLTAPFEYLALLWAFAFGFLIWGDVPTRHVLLGAAFILASGIALVLSEHLKRRLRATVSPR